MKQTQVQAMAASAPGLSVGIQNRLARMTLVLCAPLFLLVALGCEKESPLPPAQPRPAPDIAPPGYDGPIDPQWPPSHPADLELELRSSVALLDQLARGERHKPEVVLLPGDTPEVYAEEGRIGGFDYIEVILGPITHPDEKMPLLVLLHGRGGKPEIPMGPFLTKKPLRIFIPRGPDKLGAGYNWLATWTNSGDEELLARSLAGRVDQLAPAIDAFSKLNQTEGKPVVAGFSQGGILSYALATRFPTMFRAAFPVAGWLPTSLTPTVRHGEVTYPHIHALHGGADTVVPVKNGRETVARLKALGLPIEYTEIADVGHVVSPEMNILVRSYLRSTLHPEDFPKRRANTTGLR